MGLTTYVANDTLDWLMNFKDLFSEDEEVQKKAFYGKGALGAVGSVPLSDAMEVYNLGAAAGYWNLLSDEDETLGFLTGMREYKKIDNTEFAGSIAGMFNLETHRLITRTWPTLRNYGVMTALGQEFALYPGETTIGLNTRDLHKKYVKEKVKKPVSWRKASGGLSNKSRNRAIQSLDLLSD